MFGIIILKTIGIIILVVFAFFVIAVLTSIIKSKKKDAEKKRKAEMDNERVNTFKSKYPLFTPIKVHLDLNYLNDHYNELTQGMHEVLESRVSDGYFIQDVNNHIYFSKEKDEKKRICIATNNNDIAQIAKFL